MKKKIWGLCLAFVMVIANTTTAFAATYSFPDASISASSSQWKYSDQKTGTSWTNKNKRTRIAYTYTYYKGPEWYTSNYAVSDNYYHTYGQADLSATNVISQTHTFSSSSNYAGAYGGSIGYAYSVSTSKSVSSTISSTSSSGYYKFTVKCKYKDFKMKNVTRNQKKDSNGNWVTTSTSNNSYTGTRTCDSSSQSALYYSWQKTISNLQGLSTAVRRESPCNISERLI